MGLEGWTAGAPLLCLFFLAMHHNPDFSLTSGKSRRGRMAMPTLCLLLSISFFNRTPIGIYDLYSYIKKNMIHTHTSSKIKKDTDRAVVCSQTMQRTLTEQRNARPILESSV
jgi:hypothetical protein